MPLEIQQLTVDFFRGYESHISEAECTHTDKVLPYMSIVYPHNGRYHVRLEDGPFWPVDGGVFITMPGVRHSIVHHLPPDGSPMRPQYIFIRVLYGGVVDLTGLLAAPFILDPERSRPFIGLIRESVEAGDDVFARLSLAGRTLEHLAAMADMTAFPRFDAIRPALELMEQSAGGRLSLDRCARACGLSPAAFSAAFKKATGSPPIAFWQNKRLMKAAARLLTGADTLAAVARDTGFCDEFHFSREFKKHYGVSPSQYRRENRPG